MWLCSENYPSLWQTREKMTRSWASDSSPGSRLHALQVQGKLWGAWVQLHQMVSLYDLEWAIPQPWIEVLHICKGLVCSTASLISKVFWLYIEESEFWDSKKPELSYSGSKPAGQEKFGMYIFSGHDHNLWLNWKYLKVKNLLIAQVSADSI